MYCLLLLVQELLAIFEEFVFGVNTLSPSPCGCFPIGNILLSKPRRTFCLPLRSPVAFSKFNIFFYRVFNFVYSLNLLISSFTFIYSSSASFSVR